MPLPPSRAFTRWHEHGIIKGRLGSRTRHCLAVRGQVRGMEKALPRFWNSTYNRLHPWSRAKYVYLPGSNYEQDMAQPQPLNRANTELSKKNCERRFDIEDQKVFQDSSDVGVPCSRALAKHGEGGRF